MTANRSKLLIVNRFFSGTGSSYDRVVVLCTCGLDKYWKKRIIAKIPAHPARILDQASGTGILTFEIARAFPGCEVTGVELRDEYLELAREKARLSGISNVEFLLGRAEDVMPYGEFDCITSSYLAKYADLGTLIANAGKLLRKDGLIIIHDFTSPPNPVFLLIWHAWFRLLKTAGSRVWPEWRTAFRELPEFLQHSTWLPDTLAALRENSFRDVAIESLNFGASAIVTARKPDAPFHRTSR